MTQHIALLGDSVFDNAAYTEGAPDVAAHLRDVLGEAWRVSLLARDGSTTTTVGAQFGRLDETVAHVVLSLGGNDALLNAELLATPVDSTGTALDLFGSRLATFEAAYRAVLSALGSRRLTVCTIYNGNLGVPEASRARVALRMFNDVIVSTAADIGADVIDLRSVCTMPEHFANPIEPSGSGGRRIARAVARVLALEDAPETRVYRGQE